MRPASSFRDVYFVGAASIGLPKEARILDHYQTKGRFPNPTDLMDEVEPVAIGRGSYIGNGATIYEGTQIGNNAVLEDFVRIGFGCRLDDEVRVMYGAYICDRVHLGPRTRAAGFVCDAANVGADCSIMGQIVHKYTIPDLLWGAEDEAAPTVEDDVVVGYGAIVVGGLTIGRGSYVAAGAIVTRSVPPNTVVTQTNVHTAAASWPGKELNALFIRRGLALGPR